VSLQRKEIAHLIQCGALDGLGEHRAALLEEVEHNAAAGAQQVAFAFMAQQTLPEDAAQRLEWEQHILGQPVSVQPLELWPQVGDGCVALVGRLPCHASRCGSPGMRLPGWSGGKGFYLSDGVNFCSAAPPRGRQPPAWAVLHIRGRWLEEEWVGGWLQIEAMERVRSAISTAGFDGSAPTIHLRRCGIP
jgi:hypothetical protein